MEKPNLQDHPPVISSEEKMDLPKNSNSIDKIRELRLEMEAKMKEEKQKQKSEHCKQYAKERWFEEVSETKDSEIILYKKKVEGSGWFREATLYDYVIELRDENWSVEIMSQNLSNESSDWWYYWVVSYITSNWINKVKRIFLEKSPRNLIIF